MDTVLAFASLWWLTDTYPSSIYAYRQVSPDSEDRCVSETDERFMGPKMGKPTPKPKQPLGYSKLPYDLGSAPIHWVEKEYNVVWSKEHNDVSLYQGSRK
jgi:microsomal epoxide hydrolase